MALHSGGLFSKPHQLHWLLDAAQLEFQSLRLWGAWQLQHAIWTPSSLPKLAGGWWFMWFAMTVTLPEMLGAIYCMHVIFLSARNGKSKLCIFWDVFLSSQCFFVVLWQVCSAKPCKTCHLRPPGRGECISTLRIAGQPCCISETIQIQTPLMTVLGLRCNVSIVWLADWRRARPCIAVYSVVVV